MKKAVIVVGSHHTGKSRTIKEFFKPLVGLSGNQRCFSIGPNTGAVFSQSLEEREGRVFSQSLEEKGLDDVTEFVLKYMHYQMLVFAARPDGENPSLYSALKGELEKQGFDVLTVKVLPNQQDSFYEALARNMLAHLT